MFCLENRLFRIWTSCVKICQVKCIKLQVYRNLLENLGLGAVHIWRHMTFAIFWPPSPLIRCFISDLLLIKSDLAEPPLPPTIWRHIWTAPCTWTLSTHFSTNPVKVVLTKQIETGEMQKVGGRQSTISNPNLKGGSPPPLSNGPECCFELLYL